MSVVRGLYAVVRTLHRIPPVPSEEHNSDASIFLERQAMPLSAYTLSIGFGVRTFMLPTCIYYLLPHRIPYSNYGKCNEAQHSEK
ncbi:hypothetical protein NDU88_004766 [Pleurodeles waltl]|uniref:Uncharacterized protein n=1 Tax=Pleurodeles waltl TaxID=8319 RepID=A0AAV7NKL5_PLEWA|nr:hypothetical protein NDU88_004766 [Pleurodeles waltl]